MTQIKKFLKYLRYFFFEIKNPITFRFIYASEKIMEFMVISINSLFHINLPKIYLLKKDYIIKNKDGSWKIKAMSGSDIAVSSVYESELYKYFNINKGIFIDIGAHIGKYSIMVGKKNVIKKVYAIEANPITYSYLKENIFLNRLQKKIIPINLAVSDNTGNLNLSFSINNLGTASIVEDNTGLIVKSARFDDLLKEQNINADGISLIKIDVEGHEYNVLRGMSASLLKIPAGSKIICEILPNQKEKMKILDYIKKRNFKIEMLPTKNDYLFTKIGKERI